MADLEVEESKLSTEVLDLNYLGDKHTSPLRDVHGLDDSSSGHQYGYTWSSYIFSTVGQPYLCDHDH